MFKGDEIIVLSSDSEDDVVEIKRPAISIGQSLSRPQFLNRISSLASSKATTVPSNRPPLSASTPYAPSSQQQRFSRTSSNVEMSSRSSKSGARDMIDVKPPLSMLNGDATITRTPLKRSLMIKSEILGDKSDKERHNWSEASVKSLAALRRLRSRTIVLDNESTSPPPARRPTLALPTSPSKALLAMNLFNSDKKFRIAAKQSQTPTPSFSPIQRNMPIAPIPILNKYSPVRNNLPIRNKMPITPPPIPGNKLGPIFNKYSPIPSNTPITPPQKNTQTRESMPNLKKMPITLAPVKNSVPTLIRKDMTLARTTVLSTPIPSKSPTQNKTPILPAAPRNTLQWSFEETSRLIGRFLCEVDSSSRGCDPEQSMTCDETPCVRTLTGETEFFSEEDGNSRPLAEALKYGATADEATCDIEPQPLQLESSSSQELCNDHFSDIDEFVKEDIISGDNQPITSIATADVSYRRMSRLFTGLSAGTVTLVVRQAIVASLQQLSVNHDAAMPVNDFSYAKNSMVKSYLDASDSHKMAAMWCVTNFVECGTRPSRKLLMRLIEVLADSNDAIIQQHAWSALSRLQTTVQWLEDDGHLLLWKWWIKCGQIILTGDDQSRASTHDLLARFVVGLLESDVLSRCNTSATSKSCAESIMKRILSADAEGTKVLSIVDCIADALSTAADGHITSLVESHIHHCQRMLNLSMMVSKNVESLITFVAERFCTIYANLASSSQRRSFVEFVGPPTVKVMFLASLLERHYEIPFTEQRVNFKPEFSASKLLAFHFSARPIICTKDSAKKEEQEIELIHILVNILNAYATMLNEGLQLAVISGEQKHFQQQLKKLSQGGIAIDRLEATQLARTPSLANNPELQFWFSTMQLIS